MTVDQFIDRLDQLTQTVENGADSAWAFAAEQTAQWLRAQVAGTNLSNNIEYTLDGTMYSILAPTYILYQNYGVAGAVNNNKGARPDEFNSNYTHKYGARPYPGLFSRYTTDKSHQFAIATNIQKYGIRPKNWFTKTELIEAYTDYAQQFINNNIQ